MDNKLLIERLLIERNKFDRSGIYAYTQRTLAYNSNKIEGSTLNEEQTASLFDVGALPPTDSYYRAKDVEEANGHFLMFNYMLDTLQEDLSEDLIKSLHNELKRGVFEDRANGYAIGEYKKRPNMIGIYHTVAPSDVHASMSELLLWYNSLETVTLCDLALFHVRYESIHPFQDGNGRTGRLILFRECLRSNITPVIIEDKNRLEYIGSLQEYRKSNSIDKLTRLLEEEQSVYYKTMRYFLEP